MSGASSRHRATASLAAAAALLAVAAPSAGAAEWELFPLPVPPGGVVSTPLGHPGDLSFAAPNRGLMTVEGNTSVPKGIYRFDGRAWQLLSTVCGADGEARAIGRPQPIVWAGPREFWTLTEPSPGVLVPNGTLCHFKDGAVVGSHGLPNTPGYVHRLTAGACRAPDDCWFGGVGGESLDRTQVGGFRLRWDGSRLHPSYAPQGREVTDMETVGGRIAESVRVGDRPFLRDPEPVPVLLHWNDGGLFVNDPWVPAPVPGVPVDGTELYALDGDGTTTWAVGGAVEQGRRLPVAARLEGGRWVELPIHGDRLRDDEVFGDVAAIPGTTTAWATLARYSVGSRAQPRFAFIAADGRVTVHELGGTADPPRGAAVRVACPASDDCWLATVRGYLFRWGGNKDYAVDDDPAFQGTISERPNEGAAQLVPDMPPADDSRLHAPPVEVPIEQPEADPECRRPPRLMTGVRRPVRTLAPGTRRGARNPRYQLTVRFRLARRARVALIAERRDAVGGARAGARSPRRRATRVVARTRLTTLRPGRRRLSVTVTRATWPRRLRFVVREVSRPRCA